MNKQKSAVSPKEFRTFPCVARQFVSELEKAIGSQPSFRDSYMLSEILSKYTGTGATPESVRARRAFDKVYLSEAHNAKTNFRLESWQIHHQSRWGHMGDIFSVARGLIRDVIGEFSYDVYKLGGFTNGAAVGYRRNQGDPWYKFHGEVTCTPGAEHLVRALVRCHPSWEKHLLNGRYGKDWLRLVPGNVGFTVEKNAEEKRFACMEPTGNMYLQTGIGAHFRASLKRIGIDLDDQSRNANAAWWGSVTGEDATLDLRRASDSNTVSLAFQLLDDKWFEQIMLTRSPYGYVDDKWIPWSMLSSMGNGFTFELESLFFWALSEAVRRTMRVPGRVLVYGDDIIVPTPTVHAVIAVLSFAGFTINKQKSHWSGGFRESCGGHFYEGLDVTPIYIRKPITDTSRVIWFLNRLRAWADCGGICDDRFSDMYFKLRRKYVDRKLWGGKRIGSISSLVTPHKRWKRLKFICEGQRLHGITAVLRSFMYSQSRKEIEYDIFQGAFQKGAQKRPEDDPQIYWEMYGSIPLTTDMTQICVVSEAVSIEDNLEGIDQAKSGWKNLHPAAWSDSFPLWVAEIA